jgi:hypothetical protein
MSVVVIPNVKCNFISVFSPERYQGKLDSNSKYKLLVLIPKNDTSLQDMIKGEIEIVNKSSGANLCSEALNILQDGLVKGYAGCMDFFYFSASNKRKPSVVNRDATVLNADTDLIKNGCFLNVAVEFYIQKAIPQSDRVVPAGVRAMLKGVQFVREGVMGTEVPDIDVTDHFKPLTDQFAPQEQVKPQAKPQVASVANSYDDIPF